MAKQAEYVSNFRGNNPDAIGSLGYKLDGRLIHHYILPLDECDVEYLSSIFVKDGLRIVRGQSDRAASQRISYFMLVDIERMLVYFNDPEASEQDKIQFETRGTKLEYLVLEIGK